MTAVEWLVNELNNQKCWADPARIEIIVQQALEMEKEQKKQQIMDAFNDGINDECLGKNTTPEQYYNSTFNK
jgi:hypothetical protein